MVQVTNKTMESLPFVVGRDARGEPITEDVAPGETKELDVPENAPLVRGRLAAGVISVGNTQDAAADSAKSPNRMDQV